MKTVAVTAGSSSGLNFFAVRSCLNWGLGETKQLRNGAGVLPNRRDGLANAKVGIQWWSICLIRRLHTWTEAMMSRVPRMEQWNGCGMYGRNRPGRSETTGPFTSDLSPDIQKFVKKKTCAEWATWEKTQSRQAESFTVTEFPPDKDGPWLDTGRKRGKERPCRAATVC